MLRTLDIRDMLLIDRLELDFAPGLNVLTGETGAGKSILLDCLGFVLGWRGRAELVRKGASQGEVVAVFDLPADHPARGVLAAAGLPVSDELILRRVNSADGRKTAYINDRRASGDVLRSVSATLVELHGQQDDGGLLNARGHRAALDLFAGHDGLLAATRSAWAARAAAAKRLSAAQAALAAVKGEEDFLRHAVAELEKLAPEPGEEDRLDTQRRVMQAAEKIRSDVVRAAQMLGLEGAEGAMRDADRWLQGAADRAEGQLDAPLAALERALIELGEASAGVEAALEAMSFDPRALEACEERLFALRAAARKHGVQPDELADLTQKLSDRLAALDAGEEGIATLEAEVAQAQARYQAAAADLSKARHAAAGRLDAAMAAELAPLKLERAVFATLIGAGEPGPEGSDAVAFTVATNPGAPAGPLDKIASGGELSRFLLALKVVLAKGADALVLIFDEIDRGVGGATADAVGRRLAKLSEGAQVLVVTHSPQVAARGAQHFQVAKSVADGMTTSRVVPLAPEARVDEIARMISGAEVTDAARAAAQSLLAS
ncbi:DNA replication and repair protein RecN [Rhodobacter aestuarii]|uniref:DNA repair protein RecN n=1 Tax=Rhodobacter aestuarii TaxID=453582 RepID=A0A1N7IW59_9RHOB|nr:DNA repair protein RecN [Rhodobacter aestuarii]PTV97474.1 DNA replication and repair protein RecN [Rhodobacter aestuarii]SIS41236.1 DNA replication and repair protein RecN [Rhodobacter aestuarii]